MSDAPETHRGNSPEDAAATRPGPAPEIPVTAVRAPSAAPGTVIDSGFAPPPSTTPGAPGFRLGKYVLQEELGRGGMGVVYRAVDTELRREVALKTIQLGDPKDTDLVERFLREARTAAALAHPGIVPVYDVGSIDGTPFYAMALVRGSTLHAALQAGRFPGFRARAQVLLAVFEAIAHAHRQGVIHRDLKPANVLLDEADRPFVMDFGLAKRLDSRTQLTVTGASMGTPQYMPPEQVEGRLDAIGPHSDVYALGGMLYEVLTGHPPFEGATVAEIVGRVLREDPLPPRKKDPRIPIDLETICLRALQKEPARRYPTAGELAADLGRFLQGEAILARPESRREKAWRWAGGRKVVVALAGAVVVALGIAGAFAVHAHRAGLEHAAAVREQVRLVEQLRGDLREKSGLYLDAILDVRRAGGTMQMGEKYLARLQSVVEEAERCDPGRPEPRFHLGVMYRALMRIDDALAEQERALDKDPAFAPSLYERALLNARRYSARLQALVGIWRETEGARLAGLGALRLGGAGGERMRQRPSVEALTDADAEAKALHERIVADLHRLETAAAADPAVLSPARRDCARGLFLASAHTSTEDRVAAKDLLEGALRADPSLEEAYEGLAQIATAAGNHADAVAAYTRGIEQDRGFVPHRIGRGNAETEIALDLLEHGADAGPDYRRAEADFSAALELDPQSVDAWRGRALVALHQGAHRFLRGEDPGDLFDKAGKDLDRALEIQPGSAWTLLRRGHLCADQALWRDARGKSPDEGNARAEADYREAIRLEPKSAEAWDALGTLHLNWGSMDLKHGRDPTIRLRNAESEFEKALAQDPRYAIAWRGRAGARTVAALFRSAHGQDPGEMFVGAEADFGRSLELDPTAVEGWLMRGEMWVNRGVDARGRGGDPRECWAKADADFSQSLKLDATRAEARLCRARVRFNGAIWAFDRGEDPFPLIAKAEADLEEGLKLNPASTDLWKTRGSLRSFTGDRCAGRSEDPTPVYRKAEADFAKALKLDPASAESWSERARLRATWGEFERAHGRDPAVLWTGADADNRKASEFAPGSADLRAEQGDLHLRWAIQQHRRRQDPAEHLQSAAQAFAQALELNPAAAKVWWQQGRLWMTMGDYAHERGEDAEPLYERAEADLGKSLELDSAGSEACTTRGDLRRNRGIHAARRGADPGDWYKAALADFAKALERNPASAEARRGLGLTYVNWGMNRQGLGPEAGEHYAKAVEEFGKALELDASSGETWGDRGVARANWGTLLAAEGKDPGGKFSAADGDYARALELDPTDADSWRYRGALHVNWGHNVFASGQDASDLYGKALDEFDHALALDPENGELRGWRGKACACLDRWADSVADLEAAVRLDPRREAEFAESLEIARTMRRVFGDAGRIPPGGAALDRAEKSADAGDWESAAPAYAEGLEAIRQALEPMSELERTRAFADPTIRIAWVGGHLALATLSSQRSIGKASPSAEVVPLAPEEAGKLRDEAFTHLEEMVKLGWPAANLESQEEFAPLHEDLRWAELLKKAKR